MKETRWWWVRHAPVIQAENRIYGQTDLPCDCTDDALFQGLARALPSDALLVTSDLLRAVQTADAIAAAGLSLPNVIRDTDFREQHFGDWQGEMREEFYARRGGHIPGTWLVPPEERAPNGESFADLVSRVIPAVERYTLEHGGRDIVCVAHGGTIKAALGHALDLDYHQSLSFTLANCSVTRIDHLVPENGDETWRIGMVNWLPHR